MKKLTVLFGCMVLSGILSGNLMSQDNAVIKIDFDRQAGMVDPNIYGAFVEPIRNVVYGSIYDPASPFADENGFRKDFVQLVRELKIPVVRWPGGNYVSGYNWEDGIGPKEQRPARLDLAWHQVESNHMGTDEYVQLCKLLGAENFICINAGTGTLDQARHWVEYCNIEKGTYYSDLRRKYGNEEPFKVKYWALGNEIDGPWQMGQKSAEDYVKFALEAGKLMQLVDKDIKLIASGASNYKPDNGWIDWNDYVLTHMTGSIDYLSVHRYATEALGNDRSFSGMMCLGLDLDQKIETVKALILKAMTKTGSTRPVYISFDEWAGGFGNSITVSLMVAQHLNSFIRHADIVKMANMTMLSSLVGYSPEGAYKNATYKAFWLYSNNCFGISLDVSTDCEKYSNAVFEEIPYLDVTAVLNNEVLVINVVNRHETKAIETDIVLQTGEFAGTAEVNEVNGKIADPGNPRAAEAVNTTSSDIKFKGNTIRYSFPAHSFTQIMVPLR
ncbi:MAG: alpha-L-arabinofuranosidase [Bacteroidales bacterium]|jgi:alpha-N-arabinofuranosidase|nr:alpha-N-arabinofuranosidase [Bacteroidales bacterium]MCB9029091.1 alpha-L-arabinofuranosidase [Bacteroidales bacterium]MDD3735740.1 alpha-L-arabinofuranosidase C-terminal domain-containing protein [Bacteroidales bacterium]NLD62577.1 alpha-L-arabinofuranosidase [Bacteroidales bacterium]HNT93223.1 alpha-L-arabinofuranosidase C-terminal domain-containing protein [Bacteroidales bacterium]